MCTRWTCSALDWIWDAVGFGDAERFVMLPVGPLAVFAAVLDEVAAGAARQSGLVAFAVGTNVGVVAGGGLLLLGWHGFGRGL